MADSNVELAARGREEQEHKETTSTNTPGFRLFGRMVTVIETIKQSGPTSDTSTEKPPIAIEQEEGSLQLAAATTATGLVCPRCKSRETKFCYFNNYNVNQPRHFCRGCHRYWTAGGAIRNVPVGTGRRKANAMAGKPLVILDGGQNGFGYSNALMMDDVVVQQWLPSHDCFPAKRPNLTAFHERIR